MGCELWVVYVCVCVWTVGCGRFGLLECASKILYYTFIFNLPATRRCCVLLLLPFVVVPFGTVLSLSPSFSFSSHACSLTLLLSMPFLLYVVCACIHTNIRTYVSSCVCIGIRKCELFILIIHYFFFCCNYSSFSFGIHSFTLDSPLIPFIYAHPHTQNPYMHTYVRRCGCDVGGSLCEDLMLAVFVCVYMCVCVPACVRVLVCVRVCARKSINVPLSF